MGATLVSVARMRRAPWQRFDGGLCLRRVGPDDGLEPIALASLLRLGGADAKPADFGLSLQEARVLLGALQRAVVQDQVNAYDAQASMPRLRPLPPHQGVEASGIRYSAGNSSGESAAGSGLSLRARAAR